MDKGAEIAKWISNQSVWVQLAADQILSSRGCFKDDVDQLATWALEQAAGELKMEPTGLSEAAFGSGAVGELAISYLDGLSGVNALNPTKSLKFGAGSLVVVYGANGTGKSGYTRLLKHACGARGLK